MTADLVERPGVRVASDYASLMAQIRGAGLLRRSVVGYLPRIAALAALAAAGGAAFWWLGQSWWQLAVAAVFAVLFGQLGFLGHDAGHQQIFPVRSANDRLGRFLSNACIGLSYRWWVGKHTRHHQQPNNTESDPDVQRGAFAWTQQQADEQRGVLRFIARHQARLFVPFLLLEAINLHVSSVRALARAPRGQLVEIALLAGHVGAYLGLLFWWLPPGQALAFVAVHQGLLGLYLGCSFAPNHKGMYMPRPGERMDFLRRQVLTSRNVRGGRALTAGLGALNYQVEHHLFPSMPSHNLRRAQPLVRDFCAHAGVAYTEAALLDSYRESLRFLHHLTPRAVRPGPDA